MSQSRGDPSTRFKYVLPRHYADINDNRPPEYWDYENASIPLGSPEDYAIGLIIGRGRHSEVFEGLIVSSQTPQNCVIKVLKPGKSESRIKREVIILHNLAGESNTIALYDVVRDQSSDATALIVEYADGVELSLLSPFLTDMDIRFYMRELLVALDYCHSQGIMHRDVKPKNVMIDHEKRQLRLIDWGLAEFYHAGCEYSLRVASRGFEGPELLVGLQTYDYSLDMWSFGCMLAGLIFREKRFFHSQDRDDQLVTIARVLGTDELFSYLAKYGLELDPQLDEAIGRHPRCPWTDFITEENQHQVTEEAIDVIDKLLRYDHAERMLPKEAFSHPYFASLPPRAVHSDHAHC